MRSLSKKDIDTQITRQEISHDQAVKYFQREYHIPPEQARTQFEQFTAQAKSKERLQARLQEKLAPRLDAKEATFFAYQKQKLLAEINPESQKIKDELTRLDQENRPQIQSIKENIAYNQSQRTLDILSAQNFQRILQSLTPQQAEALRKQRELEMEREVRRGLYRNW